MSAGEFSAATVALIWKRDRGCCAWCGLRIRGDRGSDWSVHHREPRGMGGSRRPHVSGAANGVLLHGSGTTGCHGKVEADRAKALELGFLVSRIGVRRPAEVEIKHAVHGMVLMVDEGGKKRLLKVGER